LSNAEKKLETLEKANRQLEKAIASKNQQKIELENQRAKTEKNLKTLEQDTSQSICPLCRQNLNEETSAQLRTTFKQEIRDLEKQDKFLTTEIDQIQKDLSEGKENEEQLIKQVQNLRDKKVEVKDIENVRRDVEEQKISLEELQEKQRQLEQNDEKHPLIQRQNDLRDQWRKTREELMEISKNKEKLQETQEEVDKLENKQKLLEKIKAKIALERELEKTKSNLLQKEKEFQKEKENLVKATSPLDKIQEDLKEKKEERDQQTKEINRYGEDYAEIDGRLREIKKRISDLKEECAVLPAKRKEFDAKTEETELNQILINSVFSRQGVANEILKRLLPELEREAGKLLMGLSQNRFNGFTIKVERETKTGKRSEDLEWFVSDSQGDHALPRFSGGEKFRIHLALRLAISEILSRLTGTMKRPETLIIDEGFGSLDTNGKQAVLEALNYLKSRFARVIVITHVDDVKESLPSLIDVSRDSITQQSRVHLETNLEEQS
ncbi:MAG: SbcC/MukB-like Walker B domain-containing protein, partial [Candidatus Hodarchaeota archaeon]